MKEYLTLADLNQAVRELCEQAHKRCAFILPTHTFTCLELEEITAHFEQRPQLKCELIITRLPSQPGIESVCMKPVSRLPFVDVRMASGDFNALFANERVSIHLPGHTHPLAANAGYTSQIGIEDQVELKSLLHEGKLVYRRTPQFKRHYLGLKTSYVGSNTESFGVSFCA